MQAALIVCGVVWTMNGYLPAAHGRNGVTPEQFAANFNSYRSYADGYYNVAERLRPDGSWESTGNGTTIVFDINGGEAARPETPFVLETNAAGLVERIAYTWEDTAGDMYVAAPASTVLYAMYSFAGAQPGASAFAILAGDEAYRTVVDSGLTGFALESNGIRITYTVECRGYRLPGPGGWPYAILEDDAGPDACLRVFLCMEKLPAA